MTTLLQRFRPRAALPDAAPRRDGTALMVLVLFALVFVPVLAVHAAFVLAPRGAGAQAPVVQAPAAPSPVMKEAAQPSHRARS